LASEFIANDELPPLLRAADERGALIIPVIVGPCLFLRHEELTVFQAANDPRLPLLNMSTGDSEGVFVEVAERILSRADQAETSGRPPVTPPSPLRENFMLPDTWARLIRIGDWVYDAKEARIIANGPNAFLVSREEYGNEAFSIQARLSFTPHPTTPEQKLGFNAGIILGWTHEKKSPRYFNILITGKEIVFERVGLKDQRGRSAEHLTTPKMLDITSGREYDFRVHVSGGQLSVSVDGVELLKTEAGPLVGRVGVRPWRSTLSLYRFTVQEADL